MAVIAIHTDSILCLCSRIAVAFYNVSSFSFYFFTIQTSFAYLHTEQQ